MKKNIFSLFAASILFLSLSLVSCKKQGLNASDDITSTETVTDNVAYKMEQSTNSGKFGCFDIVYPVSITLPDENAVVTVNNRDELVTAIKEWAKSKFGGTGSQHGHRKHTGRGAHPTFVLPITVISESGEAITVNTEEELKMLRTSCNKGYFSNGNVKDHTEKGKPCITFNFPVTVQFPDGTTQEAKERSELQAIAKMWHQGNPSTLGHPQLVFPIKVTQKDGTEATANSREELQALRASCN